ncbi:MAG: DNA translocase FtsK 4TM domain-containing protein [Bernardetiaceae bacterium]
MSVEQNKNSYRVEPPQEGTTTTAPFWPDRRLRLVLGLSLMLFSLYLGLAFLSFFWTGAADQSVVESLAWKQTTRAAGEITNWLGLTGAVLSHTLVYRWFGMAALLLAPLLGWTGYLLWRDRPTRHITDWLRNLLFLMLALSVFLGYITAQVQGPTELAFWCGGIGYAIAAFMDGIIGIGTLLLLGLLVFAYVIYFLPSGKVWLQNIKKSPAPKPVTATEEAPHTPEPNIPPIPEEKPKTKSKGFKNPFQAKAPKETPPPSAPTPEQQSLPPSSTTATATAEQETPVPLFAEDEEVPNNQSNTPDPDPIAYLEDEDETSDEENTDEPELDLLFADNDTPTPPKNQDIGAQFEQDAPHEKEIDIRRDPKLFPEEDGVDPVQELPNYSRPPVMLLEEHDGGGIRVDPSELQTNKDKIVGTLANFKIGVDAIKAEVGPTVTLYEIVPSQGVKISQIRNLEDDIALNLAALGIRIIAPMPGRGTIGIEVPNKDRETVSLRSLIESKVFRETKKDLPVVLGKTISNEVFITDLAKMPHLLIGGATGQGKSVGINVLLTSLLYKKHPGELKIVLIDPKKVEFSLYNKLDKHYIAHLPDSSEPVITEAEEAIRVLNALCVEMDKRYTLLKRAKCRQVKEYNAKILARTISIEDGHRYLPYIVVVIDELADLMITVGKSIEKPIARLAQMARAVGMHMVVATQRPSVNVLTGVIKANFPARMAFRVTSKVDSRVVLDMGGAEQLVGRGDMLLSNGADVIRLQCAFIDTDEVENICDFIAKQDGYLKRFYLPEWGGHLEAEEGEEEKKKKKQDDF